jgi:hypothetical protein
MKRSTAWFFQIALVLLGLGVLAFLLGAPHVEGRNAHATTFEIYFKDPFLAYVYAGSIPFFIALCRAIGLFGHAGRNGAFSPATLAALRVIKRCALILMGFVAGGAVFILIFGDKEDRPPGVFMSLLAALATGIMAFTAARFARKVQDTLRRSEGSR